MKLFIGLLIKIGLFIMDLFAKPKLILIKYGRKHLFKVSMTTSFILLTSSTKADEPLPNLPALSINILSKASIIP